VRVLVTGATGFVGSALCKSLVGQGLTVTGAVRILPNNKIDGVDYKVVAGLSSDTKWSKALDGVNAVVHCAARVHVMREIASDPIKAFNEVNVEGTVHLAKQAVLRGIERFIFISSIKVNGERTNKHLFRADDVPYPEDPYGISKWETEQALKNISGETGLEVVIIRPPLVYGVGVRANFLRLMQAIKLGLPLPLGSIQNRRSLVALDNLVDLIVTSLFHSAAANQTFLVSDGEDLSTPELIRRIAVAMRRRVCLYRVPVPLLMKVARLLGKSDLTQRLCSSLQVDTRKNQDLLGWHPRFTVDEALIKTVNYFLSK
jgi:UDP-4-keto-D-QuiNAc 4-reductase